MVLPTGKSVWVANDKTRQVIFTQRQHQAISSWTVQILDSQGQSVVNFPNQILLATSGGDDESSRYQTSLPVPQYVGTGTYRVRVCGQPEVKAAEKCCAESGDFHIEGTSLEGRDQFAFIFYLCVVFFYPCFELLNFRISHIYLQPVYQRTTRKLYRISTDSVWYAFAHKVFGKLPKNTISRKYKITQRDAKSRRVVPRYGLGATSGLSGSRQRLIFTT